MNYKQFSAEQMTQIVAELNAGNSAQELARKYGISDKTIYNWRKKYNGLVASDVKKMRSMEEENSRLRRIIANLTIDNDALKALLEKKW